MGWFQAFYLSTLDGSPLPAFQPGQYLSVKVHPAGYADDQIRQYSLSCDPNDRYYRISVQREVAPSDVPGAPAGLVSNYLHDAVHEGDELAVHMLVGDFTLNSGTAPVVLLSGGSGITVMLSMLEHLANGPVSGREVVLIHAARSRARHAFAHRLHALGKSHPRINVVTLYEEVGPDDIQGHHYSALGRISAELLKQHMPEASAEFDYCGPKGFMAAVEQALTELGVPLSRRHSEAFGPDPSFAALASVPAPQAQLVA